MLAVVTVILLTVVVLLPLSTFATRAACQPPPEPDVLTLTFESFRLLMVTVPLTELNSAARESPER